MSKNAAPTFEPRIIEQFAESLYRKASAFLVSSVVAGVVLGMAFGAVPLTSLGSAWPIPSFMGFATMLLGGLVGGVIGYSIGDARSFGYRLQAQTTLLQLEMERNSAETAYLLQLLVEGERLPAEPAVAASAPARGVEPPVQRAQRAEPAPAPVPVSAPAPAPVPVSAPASAPVTAAPAPVAPAPAPTPAAQQSGTPQQPPLSPPVTGPSVAVVR